jgi:hypothetical protein
VDALFWDSLTLYKRTNLSKTKYLLPFLFFTLQLFAQQRQRVGVVLSGGGASGVAHVGVLKALEEHQIPIDYIVGTSAGALVGAMYASGYSPAEIEAYVLSESFQLMVKGQEEADQQFLFYLKTAFFKNLCRSPLLIPLTSITRCSKSLAEQVFLSKMISISYLCLIGAWLLLLKPKKVWLLPTASSIRWCAPP